jgi:hypothetical protein
MFEYQFSVSLNGQFLFRTDWSRDNVPHVAMHLRTKFPSSEGYTVICNKRNTSYTQEQVN